MAEKVELEEGVKPVTGAPSSFGRGTAVRQLDDEGRIKTVRTSGAPLDTTNVKTPQEAANPERIGDYYYDSAKNLQVWENSPTDLLQKYRLAVGGTEKPADLLSPSGEALSILGPAVGTGLMAGAAAGGPAGLAVGAVAGLIGGLTNFNNAREEALKRWQEENVKYDSAVEFYKDDDGSIKYKVDYQKMGTGGPRSGERIKEAQNRETQVSLGDDGRLKVKVSPIFASTARFQEMMDFISTNYGNLSKDTENLDQVLTEIKDGIDGEAKDYISNMRLYADFAQKFQNASPETIVSSYTTEMAGYVDPTKMKDFQMTVLGDGDKAATRSAAEFFDSVLSMDKTGRNDLAAKLNDIVYGESNNYSDDQRAIAYGELQAMYTASANPEKFENNKYQGMMDADGFVSFMNSFSPLGLNGGDVLKFLSGGAYSKQEMLNPDEWAQFFGGAAGIGAGFGIWKGTTSLIEAGLKRLPGTAALFNASISGKGTEAMAWLAQNAGKTSVLAKAWGAEAAFKVVKLGIFDAALAGSQTAVSNKDFWSNFGQDFARDVVLELLFSYYDMVAFKQATSESVVRVYEDPNTGNMVPVHVPEGETIPEQIILTGDGTQVDETFTSVGASGKPEEFVRTGNGTSVYKLKGKANITKTRTGDVVGIYEDPNVSQIMLNGKTYTISHTPSGEGPVLLESGDIGVDEFPVMSSGVVNVTPSSDADEISKIMTKMNLPANTKTWEVPESSANAAMVAGKMAAVQNTKVGMEIYKQLFNKNGVLDVANNMALARDGDLNSWRNAQEYFVSVQNNAMRNLNDIQNGVYFKEAAPEWAKTVELMGKFNYEYKYKPKTDGAYINAILNIERAELLNQSRVEGDTTDYVAKALEVYGDVLAKMPADRGQLLQNWVQQGKKWLKAFNESVKKSGKVDVEKLENIMDTDIDSDIGWFPVWGKKQKYKGLLDSFRGITKERNPYKSWLRDGEWVPADELGDPWNNMNRYMGFVTNNMGLNDMIEQAATVYDRAGLLVDNTPTDATIRKRKLESIRNKDELNKKLDKMIADVKKEVEERTLTPAEYSDTMAKIYEDSAILETTESLGNIVENLDGLRKSAPAQAVYEIVDSKGIKYTDGNEYAKGIKAGNSRNVAGYEKFGEEKLERISESELSPEEEKFSLLFVRPGGAIDQFNGLVRDGIYKDSKELATDIVDAFINGELGYYSSEIETPDEVLEQITWEYFPEEQKEKADAFLDDTDEGDKKYFDSLRNIIIEKLTKVINTGNYKLTSPTVLHRGVSTGGNHVNRGGDFSWAKEGETFNDSGLAFVSLSDDVAKGFAMSGSGEKYVLDYYLPAGTSLFYFGKAKKGMGSGNGGAFVLPPVKNAKVGTITVDENGLKHVSLVFGGQYKEKRIKSPEEQQWDEFWKNAPAQTRKDIRNELEKTSLQTGYGISDTRARLNARVPGADVLDWSLLGRDHTNGLVPGGLYAGKSAPVKAYIMSIDDLAKMAGYDLDNAIPNMGKVIEEHINVKDAVPMLPAHIRGSGDGPEIWLKMRWGHNSDGVDNWTDYLKTLKGRGIEKVPVAIDDARGGENRLQILKHSDLPQKSFEKILKKIDQSVATAKKLKISPRELSAASYYPGQSPFKIHARIRNNLPLELFSEEDWADVANKALLYDWSKDKIIAKRNSTTIERIVEEKLGYVPQDITADVQQAFAEYGRIPWFHSQHAPLGSAEFNAEPPTGEAAYTAQDGVGDALWVAPNSSYTDDYGKNKTIASIPMKYFMSDKEMKKTADEMAKRLEVLSNKMQKLWFNKVKKIKKLPKTFIPAGSQNETMDPFNDFLSSHDLHWTGDANTLVDLAGNPYSVVQVRNADGEFSGNEITPYDGETKTVVPSWVVEEEQKKLLSPKEQKEEDLLNKAVYPAGIIKSYRALAEYAGKPVIDTTMDMNKRNIAGTAFFYYKGVDPKFDEKIGKQLDIQARGTQVWPEDLANEMVDEWFGKTSIRDFINLVGEKVSAASSDINTLLGQLKDRIKPGDPTREQTELMLKIAEDIKPFVTPGFYQVAHVLGNMIWTRGTSGYSLATSLADMGLSHDRFYNEADAGALLEELGEENPDYVTPEERQAWDVINPTNFANVPTEPQFKQPRKVTYEDYERGVQADPDMPARIQSSYRAAMANRLIKEATRVVGLAEDYLSEYGYGADWQSYLNTSLIPDLQNAINQNMLPDEFSSFVQARMAQAIQDVAPYQSPELLLKSRLEGVAQEWRDWALKRIKAGRATQKDLKEFVNSHNLELPNDKRPYPSKIKHALWEMVQNNKRLPEIEGINPTAISKEMDKKLFYQMLDDTPLFQSAVKDKNELLDLMALERNKETTDGFTMGAAATAAGLGGRYPMTWFKNGKPYTRFIKYDTKGHLLIAEQTTKALNDKEPLKEDGLISKAAAFVANDFRLLTTGWDPSRSLPNLARDTGRSFTLGRRFINAKEMLKSSIDAGNYTPKQREILEKAIENAANAASNSSYNSAYRTTRGAMKDITKDYLSRSGANPMKRFFYNVVHDKRSILEWPMEFFEGYSRRANARSLAAVQLRKDQKAGANFKTQLKNAATAAEWAGREYTANFQRKGELIGRVSKYVAYQSSAYAGFDSMMRAFINDPKLVARNFAAFVLAYLVLLADTLSKEETRKQYYRLSDYDRENQIVIGMGDSILTIPMDQELAGLLFPYRRIMETLNGTDPVSFFEFIWGSLTAALPPDLSGFSEGDGFNLSRGLEKLTSQNMPNLLTGIVETSTGYDLYYGTQTSVSKETLKDYGIYAPEPGDYTTTGKDSATLRGVANTTGIPQWQLQVMLDNYGGNVGKYVLNTLDKLSGATKDQQGGKDFANTVFNSFTGLDQDAASNAFYAGITQLKDEKNKLIQKIVNYNESLKTASGDAKVELQNKISQAKRDYGTKVGDFVDKYVSAYEITGGLPKSQAQQIYYLFRLDDDDTLYQSGSVEEYYNNQAVQQFKNQATAMSAPVLDKYYNNRLGNIYQDSEGVWRRYLSSGAQAMRNSVYGLGEQQKVDLLNILEGKNSNMKTLRTQIKNARNQAYEAQDWDKRDALAYELDKQVLQAISPYIKQYGAENVLGNTDVLEYLSEWFIVPDDFIRSKKGKYVSLGNNASTQKAFVQPFIKYIFGLPTNFSSYNDAKITPTELGGQ